MGFNSAFKGLKLLKKPGNGHLNNLNVLRVQTFFNPHLIFIHSIPVLYPLEWPTQFYTPCGITGKIIASITVVSFQ